MADELIVDNPFPYLPAHVKAKLLSNLLTPEQKLLLNRVTTTRDQVLTQSPIFTAASTAPLEPSSPSTRHDSVFSTPSSDRNTSVSPRFDTEYAVERLLMHTFSRVFGHMQQRVISMLRLRIARHSAPMDTEAIEYHLQRKLGFTRDVERIVVFGLQVADAFGVAELRRLRTWGGFRPVEKGLGILAGAREELDREALREEGLMAAVRSGYFEFVDEDEEAEFVDYGHNVEDAIMLRYWQWRFRTEILKEPEVEGSSGSSRQSSRVGSAGVDGLVSYVDSGAGSRAVQTERPSTALSPVDGGSAGTNAQLEQGPEEETY